MSRSAPRPPRAGATSRSRAPAPAVEIPSGHDARAAVLLWAGLATLVATRAAAGWAPDMAWWGWNVHRFLAPLSSGAPWAAAALALVPPVARVGVRAVAACGRFVERRPVIAGALVAAGAGALVAAFPDRLQYVGDTMLRVGALARGEDPRMLSPQAFPLDVLVHYAAPFALVKAGRATPQAIVVVIGAIGAAALGAAATAFARAIVAGPAARIAAAGIALFGGWLCLFTGENKAFAEMVAVVVAFAACAFAAVRDVRARPGGVLAGDVPASLVGAGLCVAAGVLFHRFALGLVPAWVLAWALWARARDTAPAPARATSFARRTLALVGLLAPIAVLAAMAPRLARTILDYDLATNFANAEARSEGGVLAAAFAPPRLLDVANLVLFLVPLAIPAAWAAFARGDDGAPAVAAARRRQGWIAAAIAAPFVLVFLFARPPQGLVRDWDSFATAGAALGVLAAWTVARAIDRSGRAWLAVPVLAVTAACSVQWLVHFNDESRSLARLEALMLEPPARSAADRTRTWDLIGWRHFSAQRYTPAARAFEHAVEAAPSPRNLTHWAMALAMAGDHRRGFELYVRAAERDTNFVLAWMGVGAGAVNLGEWAAAERAARHLVRLAPDHPQTQELVRYLAGRAP